MRDLRNLKQCINVGVWGTTMPTKRRSHECRGIEARSEVRGGTFKEEKKKFTVAGEKGKNARK